MPGWTEDITKATKLEDLPEAAIEYLKLIQSEIGCKIALVGVGPDRIQSFPVSINI